MGQAPWEGSVAVGKRMVMLRGQGKLGTQPVSADVKSGALSSLSVRAEELDGALRVTPTLRTPSSRSTRSTSAAATGPVT